MKSSLTAGLSAATRIAIDSARTIDFLGENARVYATPMLVRDIEVACRELLLAHLDTGEDSVGTRIELDHMAATLLGMTASLTVTVTHLAVCCVSRHSPSASSCKAPSHSSR